MKRRVTLEIHREDHKTDALGRVFLGATDRDETLALLRAYLGPQATLRHVELDDAVLRVEADVREFAEESRNLVAMARDLIRAGRVRSAIGQLEEALRLAPLGADALKALGRLYYRHRDRENARRYLTRAREVAPTDIEVLRLLAEIALHEDRRLAARERLLLRRLEQLDAPSFRDRVIGGLVDLFDAHGEPCAPRGLSLRITRPQLADLCGTLRPHVSMVLRELRTQGLVRYNHESIYVEDYDALRRLHQRRRASC